MEDVDIPAPNPFIAQWLVGPENRAMMFEHAELAAAIYREQSAAEGHVRTGALVANIHVYTVVEDDRWNGRMTLLMPYSVPENWGAGEHPASTHKHFQHAADTLNTTLNLLGTVI